MATLVSISLPWVAVMLGGAAGALARYWLTWLAQRYAGSSRLGTLGVNIVGSFALGLSAAWLLVAESNLVVRAFFELGFLGSFTTFATVMLDWRALGLQQPWRGLMYVFISIAFSVLALLAGAAIAHGNGATGYGV